MVKRVHPRRILVYEAIGFAAILALVWINEFLVFSEYIFRPHTDHPEIWESLLDTAAILAIAAVMIRMTQRVLSRLFYLERFLRVCAWCRKIQQEDRWITLEDYLSSGFATRTSHGMCPECAEKAKRELSG
jgi:hypothetical protein